MTCTTAPTTVQLMGSDPRIAHVHEIVRRVADSEATVLLRGETGTGKEVVARLLHTRSIRAREPFIAVNCGALPDSLLEAELFGATKGAFTGAVSARIGKFEAAQRGTIFLDEVASMGQAMQVALLRVLQSGEFTPVGTATARLSRARVVAAANTDLQSMVAAGSFRADLFYRLNVIQLELPPLRERRADVLPLAEHFLARFCTRYAKVGMQLSDAVRRCLAAYTYPGNVRELENAIHRAVVLATGPTVSVDDLPSDFCTAGEGTTTSPHRATAFHQAKAVLVAHFEREFLTAALQRTQGVVIDAARQVGLSERVFHVKLRKYGIRAAT